MPCYAKLRRFASNVLGVFASNKTNNLTTMAPWKVAVPLFLADGGDQRDNAFFCSRCPRFRLSFRRFSPAICMIFGPLIRVCGDTTERSPIGCKERMSFKNMAFFFRSSFRIAEQPKKKRLGQGPAEKDKGPGPWPGYIRLQSRGHL